MLALFLAQLLLFAQDAPPRSYTPECGATSRERVGQTGRVPAD
jgi:hypothetical protein